MKIYASKEIHTQSISILSSVEDNNWQQWRRQNGRFWQKKKAEKILLKMHHKVWNLPTPASIEYPSHCHSFNKIQKINKINKIKTSINRHVENRKRKKSTVQTGEAIPIVGCVGKTHDVSLYAQLITWLAYISYVNYCQFPSQQPTPKCPTAVSFSYRVSCAERTNTTQHPWGTDTIAMTWCWLVGSD